MWIINPLTGVRLDTLVGISGPQIRAIATDGDLLYLAPGTGNTAEIQAYDLATGVEVVERRIALDNFVGVSDLTWADGVLFFASAADGDIYAFAAPSR